MSCRGSQRQGGFFSALFSPLKADECSSIRLMLPAPPQHSHCCDGMWVSEPGVRAPHSTYSSQGGSDVGTVMHTWFPLPGQPHTVLCGCHASTVCQNNPHRSRWSPPTPNRSVPLSLQAVSDACVLTLCVGTQPDGHGPARVIQAIPLSVPQKIFPLTALLLHKQARLAWGPAGLCTTHL